MDVISLYIHIPFCRAKCVYCDFNSYPGLDALFDGYTAAVVHEMELAGPARARTIYVGGGTPTVLPLSFMARILNTARSAFRVDPEAEVSVEANPGTVDVETLADLMALGVTRLSLGVQSFDERELRLLGRIHTTTEAVDAFHAARQSGFDNINLDLIYGLPGQTLDAWQATLEQSLVLQPAHLSLYALTVEEGTPLAAIIGRGGLPTPDPDLAAEMYESARDTLSAAGYVHYEISNWAMAPAYQCQHNQTYWRNEPYLGIGAGAHSWSGGRRWANAAAPAEYTLRVLDGVRPVETEETIDPALEMGETMMMGLRLLDQGVEFERFRERFRVDLRQRFADELVELTELGLILADGERVRLSTRGQLLGNQVFLRFLPE
jgi:oxygen-independent coproporphyrinogen-3 oxidase